MRIYTRMLTKNAEEHLVEYFIIYINTKLANFLIYAFIIRLQSLHPLFARQDMHPCIT